MDATQKLAAARMIALTKLPYLSHAVYSLIVRWADWVKVPGKSKETGKLEMVPTMGVAKNGVLYVHPEAVAEWATGEVAGVLIHEAMHLLRDHNGRRDAGAFEPMLWNQAADLAINHEIAQACGTVPEKPPAHFMRLPETELYPTHPKVNLPPGKTAEEYYFLLQKKQKEGGGGGHQCVCGSGAGNPLAGEPKDGAGGRDGQEVQGGTVGRTTSELASMRRQTAQAIKDHASKNAGSVPGDLLRWADEQIAPPKVRWQDRIARACRSAMAYRAGMSDYTYSRISRRQWGIGTGPGAPVLPAMRAPVPRVAVAVDTSGSMGDAELREALSEVEGVIRAAGAPVDFLACDAQVHSLAPIDNWRQSKNLLRGGGGTSFVPIFSALDSRRPRPSLVVVLTDGYGPAPDAPPAGMSVIWVLIGKSAAVPAPWGEHIRLEDEEAPSRAA